MVYVIGCASGTCCTLKSVWIKNLIKYPLESLLHDRERFWCSKHIFFKRNLTGEHVELKMLKLYRRIDRAPVLKRTNMAAQCC